eukprot:CAMPEP_0116060214 /NCGR_PEP_ID=MMETSP0322-20121206/6275_1 /TAXON_ID=163516 /ORGANISM="Leptocylindrus danicus var. apora, Strain B651" /LENGTH=600 /DNA_ID=CAMNT_0003544777 /DNA_START=135 /DNA_END=1937 /DNA_ORIENTATION=-
MNFTKATALLSLILSFNGSSYAFVVPTFHQVRSTELVLGMDWEALKQTKQMKPLPGQSQSPNSYVDNVGNAPAAAPTPSSDTSSFSLSGGTGSSVASGSVWDRLSGSQQMKPLKPAGNSGNSYFDNIDSTPVPSTPAPVPVAASSFSLDSSAGSSVASGSVWASLSGSQKMKPLKPAGNSGNSYFDNFASTPAPSAPAPAPAPAAVSSFSLDSSAGSSVASGSVWASLSGSQKMKPLKPAGNSGNSYFDNFASASASNAPAPLPTPAAASSFSLDSSAESSVASGSVWSSLSGSQRMKPLKPAGKSGNSYFDNFGSTPVSNTPAYSAPTLDAPTPTTSSIGSTGGSSVASGSVWASLSGSQRMKPLKPAGISGNSYVDNMESAPVASTPVTASPVVSESPSGGSSVATGSVWDRLAGTERMKPLKPAGISGNSYVDNMGSAPVASTPVATSVGGSSVATGSVWDRLAGTERMKPLKPAGNSGNSYFDNMGSTPVTAVAASVQSAPATTSGTSVASGSVWDRLAGTQRMKPLKPAGNSGNSYFDQMTPVVAPVYSSSPSEDIAITNGAPKSAKERLMEAERIDRLVKRLAVASWRLAKLEA